MPLLHLEVNDEGNLRASESGNHSSLYTKTARLTEAVTETAMPRALF